MRPNDCVGLVSQIENRLVDEIDIIERAWLDRDGSVDAVVDRRVDRRRPALRVPHRTNVFQVDFAVEDTRRVGRFVRDEVDSRPHGDGEVACRCIGGDHDESVAGVVAQQGGVRTGSTPVPFPQITTGCFSPRAPSWRG